MRHRLRALALLLALVAPVIPAAAGAQAQLWGSAPAAHDDPEEPDMIVVEVRFGRWAARTVPAYRDGADVLLPLGALLTLAGVRYELAADGRLTATVYPRGLALDVRAASDTMRYGVRRVLAPPPKRLIRDGELYVSAQLLGQLLDVDFNVNWNDLTVLVERADDFPVARKAARDGQVGALRLRTPEAPSSAMAMPLQRPVFDGLVLDYFLSAPSVDTRTNSGYGFSLGADVAGGALEGIVNGTLGDGARAQGSWTGVFRTNRWVQQLRLGDAATTGPAPRQVRGIMLTNSPWLRPLAFSMLPFPGQLPAGWAVDAYRQGELVGADSVDESGRYALTLPVQYGDNPVDFVARGPYGEERRFSSTYRVRPEFLPPGKFEYGLSGGRCGDRRTCDGTANADFRYGVNSRLAVRAGAESFWRDTLPDRVHPYATLSGNLTTALGLRGDVVAGALAHAGLTYEPSAYARLSLDHTRYDRGEVTPALAPAGWRDRTLVTAFWRPGGAAPQSYLEATAERVDRAFGTPVQRARAAVSWSQGWMRWVPYARYEEEGARHAYAGTTAYLVPGRRAGWLLDRTWLRGTAELSPGSGVRQGAVTLSRTLNRLMQMEATTLWTPGAGGPTYALTVTTNYEHGRAFSTVSRDALGNAAAVQMLQGSIVHDQSRGDGPMGRTLLTAGPSLQRAGVVGRVFVDANNNGRYDAGELPIAGVYVRVGPVGALADSTGRFIVWDLPAFEPVPVQLDSSGFLSPLWIAATDGLQVELAPNRFQPLDVPVLAGGSAEGTVMRIGAGGARAPMGGLTLHLRELGSGTRRTIVGFDDGTWSALPLRPGRWEVTGDSTELARWGLASDTARFLVRPNVEGDQVTGIAVRVHAATPSATASPSDATVTGVPMRAIRPPLPLVEPALPLPMPAIPPVPLAPMPIARRATAATRARPVRAAARRPVVKPVPAAPPAKPPTPSVPYRRKDDPAPHDGEQPVAPGTTRRGRRPVRLWTSPYVVDPRPMLDPIRAGLHLASENVGVPIDALPHAVRARLLEAGTQNAKGGRGASLTITPQLASRG